MKNYKSFIVMTCALIGFAFLSSCNHDKTANNNFEALNDNTILSTTRGGNTDLTSPDLLTEEMASKEKSDITEDVAEYAEGYSAESFGAAFDDPLEGVTKEELQQEPEGLWKILLKLPMEVKFDDRIDDIVFAPKFTPEIKKYQGKEIEIKGYILPHDITKLNPKDNGAMFIFSAFPAATCFFCGGAGPESVMEVYPSQPIAFQKTAVTLKGTLELNATDYLKLAYKLTNAKLVVGK